MTTFACENCGAPLNPRIAHARVLDCEQCGSTSMRTDDAFHLAGERGVFHDGESIIELGQVVMVAGRRLTPVGHCQFDYGRGRWDEYWCVDDKHGGVWLSVDEGDYAIESAVDLPDASFELGQTQSIKGITYRAVEIDTASCTAFRGELPEILSLGEKHDYIVFAGGEQRMATLERWRGGHAWTLGHWFSAWDVQLL